MKKILLTSFIVALGLLGASCKDDNSTAGGGGEILPDQQVSCEIFMPTDGATVIMSDKLIIRGEGTTNYGKIISAELKVGEEIITDITSVPFYYEYTFSKDAEPGELKIELAVKGDHEGSALATITVTTEQGNRPAPPQYGEVLTDTRDGNTYKTVQLADQLWMAENLRFQHDGGAFDGCWTWNEELPELNTKQFIKLVEDYWVEYLISDDLYFEIDELNQEGYSYEEIIDKVGDQLPKELLEEFYQTNPNGEFLKEFGYLYSYEAAVAAVPEGWRLPTDEDWKALEKALGMSDGDLDRVEEWRGENEGLLLKEGTDGIGFNVKMGGGMLYGTLGYGSRFQNEGSYAYFWTNTTETMNDSIPIAYIRKLNYMENRVFRGTSSLTSAAYNVRAVKE